jgi:undecaprenyl-phosphate galactose phosphotransferase
MQTVDDVSLSSIEVGLATCDESTEYTEQARPNLDCWRYRQLKRMIDIFGSSVMIVAFAIPGLLIAIAVFFTSKGPIFYREQRVGRGGRPFQIWKFRTMQHKIAKAGRLQHAQPGKDALEWRMRKHLCDPRITSIGAFLRSWSLDELPQLFNVLRGEMSLVGPRPIVAAETALYGDLIDYYLTAVPGLSGLWQVSGRSNVGYTERALLDAQYVQTWTLRIDFRIYFMTIPAVLGRIGAR